jgi:hypothetical protein
MVKQFDSTYNENVELYRRMANHSPSKSDLSGSEANRDET